MRHTVNPKRWFSYRTSKLTHTGFLLWFIGANTSRCLSHLPSYFAYLLAAAKEIKPATATVTTSRCGGGVTIFKSVTKQSLLINYIHWCGSRYRVHINHRFSNSIKWFIVTGSVNSISTGGRLWRNSIIHNCFLTGIIHRVKPFTGYLSHCRNIHLP